jgi:hypothetical protein
MPRSCVEGEPHEQAGVATAPVIVKVWRRRADLHQLDVHVQPIADAEDVAQQPAILIHGVRLRLSIETERACRVEGGAS